MTEKIRLVTRISRSPLRMTRRAPLGTLVLAPFTALAAEVAQPADAPMNLSEDDRADLKRISVYLDGIHTMRARFSQAATSGGLASGKTYLRRPGLMRVEYEPPVPVLLVADGFWVDYYDTQLNQLTQIPITQTPVWFLLQETIDFTPATTVTRIERSRGALRVSHYQTEHPDAGSASLTFADDPLQLKQWTIKDSQGNQVEIALHGAVFGGALSNDLFATPRTRNISTGNASSHSRLPSAGSASFSNGYPAQHQPLGVWISASRLWRTSFLRRAMEKLAKRPKQSAADLRDLAWGLLKRRKHVSDQRVRRELARRALELVQVVAQLEYAAPMPRNRIFGHGKSTG